MVKRKGLIVDFKLKKSRNQGCRYVHHKVQYCTNLQKKKKITKFLSFYIEMCSVYSVHFGFTHYGLKMLSVLVEIKLVPELDGNSKMKVKESNKT